MSSYTTLANVKQYLGVQGAGDDALLTRLISAASGFVDRYTNRPGGLTIASYSDVRSGNGKAQMTMMHAPLVSVTSLVADGQVVNPLPAPSVATVTPLYPAYSFDIDTLYLTGAVFCQSRANVAVSYTAGYFVAQDGSPDQVAIEQAVIDMVALKYKQKDRIGKTSEALTGIGTVAYLVRELPADLTALLDTYKRVAYVADGY